MKRGVMMQYFEWYLNDDASLYKTLKKRAKALKESGFTALWLPPAYKGQGGIHDVGYGVYDLYDLGEFDQKGSIPTKYGTKEEYIDVIKTLHKEGIDVYADMVFNHKMGADKTEMVDVIEQDPNNRNIDTTDEKTIEAWTKFYFPGRHGKYSDFTWNQSHFSGIDYDNRHQKTAIYRIADSEWSDDVDLEKGNYDYLMGADINFENPEVREELYRYGLWYLKETGVDGFRLDALKHIDNQFFKGWLSYLRETTGKELFTVGEYWTHEIDALTYYLDQNDDTLSLFDVPLHFHFFEACNSRGHYDMGSLWNDTLVSRKAENAVTFVENHDTQAGQALQTVIQDWFKPLAYATILLRDEGYPCVFYGDYYGIQKMNTRSFQKEIDQMIQIRQNQMAGQRYDYFDHHSVVGWTFEGDENPKSGLAVLMSDSVGGEKMMYLGKKNAGSIFCDVTGHISNEITIDEEGNGLFYCDGGSYSIYIKK